jgi:hypothetical protein
MSAYGYYLRKLAEGEDQKPNNNTPNPTSSVALDKYDATGMIGGGLLSALLAYLFSGSGRFAGGVGLLGAILSLVAIRKGLDQGKVKEFVDYYQPKLLSAFNFNNKDTKAPVKDNSASMAVNMRKQPQQVVPIQKRPVYTNQKLPDWYETEDTIKQRREQQQRDAMNAFMKMREERISQLSSPYNKAPYEFYSAKAYSPSEFINTYLSPSTNQKNKQPNVPVVPTINKTTDFNVNKFPRMIPD